MYIPTPHRETDPSVLQALIQAHPLGTWVTLTDAGLVANHVPFLWDPEGGGRLVAHVARDNPIWSTFSTTVESVIVFQGAEAYITPSWYPSKHQHGKAVPTWNYAVVHVYGSPRAIQDRDWLIWVLTQLTDGHESGRVHPWQMSDAPASFLDRLIDNIVGIEIPITHMEGKWKVSQNRSQSDRAGVVSGLLDQQDPNATAMAILVDQARPQ